eukprot:gene8546-9419_t
MRVSRGGSRSGSRPLKQVTAASSPSPALPNRTMKLPSINQMPSALEDSPRVSAPRPLNVSVGVCSMQGRRPYQEDEYAIHPFLTQASNNMPETHFFGLFDGHAGGRCSKHVASNLAEALIEDEAYVHNLPQAIKRTFHTVNEQFLKIAEKMKLHDGSTGLVALIRDNKLLVANSGDCRALVVSGNKTVQMSTDHKPTNPDEQKRIGSLGGSVVYCMGVARVNRILAVSRAFGNRTIRSVIRPDAELMQRDIADADDFLVMASDGLWDVLKNKDVGDICSSPYLNRKPQAIAEELVQTALARGSMDNVTCIVVSLTEFHGRTSADQYEMGRLFSSTDPTARLSDGIAQGGSSNNSTMDDDSGELSGQTFPYFTAGRGKKTNILQEAHSRQRSLGSAELNEYFENGARGNNGSNGRQATASKAPLNKTTSPFLPNPSTKDLSSIMPVGMIVDDDGTMIGGDYNSLDRPLTALEPLLSGNMSNLPRVASRGSNLSGNTAAGTGRSVSEVVVQQKASFPAHIRSLRNHGISASFGETTSNSSSSSPQHPYRLNRPMSLGPTAASHWSEMASKANEESYVLGHPTPGSNVGSGLAASLTRHRIAL